MEKIQFMNGKKIREINVYIRAHDSANPLFQCWLTFVQDVDCDTLLSVSGKYYYGYGDENGNPSGYIHVMRSGYVLSFFWYMTFFKLQKPGDIIQGDCKSYAAAVVDFVIGGILGDNMIYDGGCMVMRVQR